MVVGAVGGVVAYRKGTQAAHRAKELGPMGSAQVAAAATSRLAGRTANGLGRLQEIKARREGRLLTGQVQEVAVEPPPAGWVPAPAPGEPVVVVSTRDAGAGGAGPGTTRPVGRTQGGTS
jgi:hypothetical protein